MKLEFKKSSIKGYTSVIIPVYRDADGLEQTLTSLKNQSIPDSDYEVIVGNDGGGTEISDLCVNYNVKEVAIVPNKGSYYARNRALEESRGEYIAFVDADISVPEYWLAAGIQKLQYFDYVGGPVVIDKVKVHEPEHLYEQLHGFPCEKFFYEQHFCVTANLFVKRIVIEDIGGFVSRLRSGGDNEFGKRVYLSGKYKQEFSESITVLHPPRGFRKLIKKGIRLHRGRILLNKMFPDRYNYEKPRSRTLILDMALPPRISSVKKIFTDENKFSFFQKYWFIWKYKFYMHLNLYKLYYSSNQRTEIEE